MEETKCSTKAKNVFKNVNAVDKDQTFDTDVCERKQTEGAGDKMAEIMEACTMDAEAASKTCQSSAGNDATASSSCAAILGNALQECAEAGMEEYTKLTGEKIDDAGLKTMKEESIAKEAGELAMTCSDGAKCEYDDCEENATDDDNAIKACKNARKQALTVCREGCISVVTSSGRSLAAGKVGGSMDISSASEIARSVQTGGTNVVSGSGKVSIATVPSDLGSSGAFTMATGVSFQGSSGSIEMRVGESLENGGDAVLAAGRGAQQGGDVNIEAGDGSSKNGGNIRVKSGGSETGIGGSISMATQESSENGDSSTGSMQMHTGTASTGSSGSFLTETGASLAGTSGSISARVGAAQQGPGGDISFQAATKSGSIAVKPAAGNIGSGSITVGSGKALSGASGSISVATGSASDGSNGEIDMTVGSNSNSAGGNVHVSVRDGSTIEGGVTIEGGDGSVHGSVQLKAGSGTQSTGGGIMLRGGFSKSSESGAVKLQSADGDTSGSVELKTGSASAASSGNICMRVGKTVGKGGSVAIVSGESNSGEAMISTGDGATSGTIRVHTGAGLLNSGSLSLSTGSAASSSGPIIIKVGDANSGVGGNIDISARTSTGSLGGNIYVNSGTSQAAGGKSGQVILRTSSSVGAGSTGSVKVGSGDASQAAAGNIRLIGGSSELSGSAIDVLAGSSASEIGGSAFMKPGSGHHTGNWNNYIHCMSGNGTYNGKDTCTIKLPATSRLVSFADVDHDERPRDHHYNNDHDKNNDDDRTTCSTSSTSVCNDIEIWKMSEEVANEQTGGVCPIVEALLSPVQEFECPASTKEKIKEVVGDANKICAGYNRTGATCLMEAVAAVAAVKVVGKNYPFYHNVDESDGQILLRSQLSQVIPTEKLYNATKVNANDDAIKNWNMSNVHITDDEAGGVCPTVEALFFPSVQECECPASASRWIASCTLDVTNNCNSTNHGKVHLIDAHGIITCPADNVPPQVGKEQGAYWCFIKEKEKRKVGEAAVHILGGINYSEANIICTGNCPRHATSRMKAVAASAVGEIRASYDSAKVVVKKSPSYHNLGESGQILHFEVNSLVVNVSWQQKEVPFLKFSLLEPRVHVL